MVDMKDDLNLNLNKLDIRIFLVNITTLCYILFFHKWKGRELFFSLTSSFRQRDFMRRPNRILYLSAEVCLQSKAG